MSDLDSGVGRATAARWRRARYVGIGVLILAVTVGVLVAPGFDERQIVDDSPEVWALQTSTGQRMARVNTAVSELDTVKTVSSPSDIIQADDTLLVYSNNLGSVTTMDIARPHDVAQEAPEGTVGTPVGTDVITHTADHVAYLTDNGEVFAGSVTAGTASAPSQLDPFADVEVAEGEDRPQFRADAVAVSATGTVAAYSAERRAVMTGSADGSVQVQTQALPEGPASDDLQMTWAGETWALLDAETGLLWIADLEAPISTETAEGALLQNASTDPEVIAIADEYGLVTVALDGTGASRLHGSLESVAVGEPARPTPDPMGNGIVAAWLPEGAGPGTLWRTGQTPAELDFGGQTLGERVAPVLRTNGSRLILNEGRSGWVWDVRTGMLVGSSQQWDINDEVQVAADEEQVATEVTDPRPPVAEKDAFGVRAGRQIALPVLLNDHDANKDVLAVEPGSLTGLSEDFGTVSVADDAQAIVIDVADDATGSASFTYAISDGTTDDGLMSDPASVTVTVHEASVNSPPEWCGVDDCQIDWPTPQVSPGGTVSADVLTGWVDPEGDPIYVSGATTSSSVGVVAASPEGQLVFQHTDPSSTETGAVPLSVEVSDVHGESASKDLAVAVLGEPELRVKDVAVTVSTGVTATVDVSDHVTGARGALTVTEASLGPDDDGVVATSPGEVGFTFMAAEPGSYLVEFVVSDGIVDGRGTARITVIADDDERLTTVPLTAFVRSKEDVTVDVLAAVTNPKRSVLLLSDLVTTPEDGAQLSADVVGHSALRLSGDTSDGQPGALGTVSYTVSDGTGRPEATVTGEVTVVLLGTEVPTTPLAVDDAITVRAGTQADIKVLANDVAPAGNVIALDAASVALSDGGGLAFPAGSMIRYLAPDEPGTYTIDYGAYVLGYPTQADTARVRVTVTADETNQPPAPQPLRGRVASGQEVRLPFDGTGSDPDGDAVTLQGIETQPTSGAARVSSDGRSLVYTADSGFAGQVSFTFSVEDARGARAVATAVVGVLDAQLDPRPVTYTDYIQAQVGEDRRVIIAPTANDQDLGGGELALVSVTPDADPDSEEFAALDAHLVKDSQGEVDLADGRVTLQVGTEPGTYAYVYTVANDSGSTSIGRIILKAVREPIADVPIITDTILTSDNRETFASGVDVLSDKVSWGAGDTSGLELSLWGEQDGVDVAGWQVSGALTDHARLIPFQVTGLNFAGEETVSYGFLRVPGEQEIRVALRENFVTPEVDENASVTFDMRDLIALPPDTRFTVDAEGVSASGVRAEGVCEAVGDTRLRYSAGRGEPYTDTCQVAVVVDGVDEPTTLPVPIIVIPEIPQPTLTGAALEISPGGTATFDLGGMVTWPDGAAGRAVPISMTYAGEQFTVERAGDVLTVTAADAAVPGHVDTVTVALGSEPDVAPVTLSLEVGPAPSALPKGGSVAQQCSQSDGTSCTITVIGASGEVNPLPGTPLRLDSVSSDGTCSGVTFSVASETSVRASWSSDTAGAVCNASFVVVDAQQRSSSGDRLGQVSVDLQGYPGSPASVSQVAYADGSVTLGVDPGAASSSYPAISGFSVTAGGTEVTTCTAQGSCSPITGVNNGEKTTYSVVATNSVGSSRSSVSTTAWSYAPPAQPTLASWKPSKAGNEGLKADLSVRVNDSSTRQLIISSPSGEQRVHTVSGRGNQTVSNYLVGSNSATSVTITPVTAHELPPVGGGSEQGEAITASVNGVGGPSVSGVTWKASTDGARVTFSASVASAGAGSTTWVGVARDGRHCSPDTQASGGTVSVPVELDANRLYDYDLCAESRWGGDVYGTSLTDVNGVYTYRDPGAPRVTEGYSVSDRCRTGNNSNQCETSWSGPSIDTRDHASNFNLKYVYPGGVLRESFDIGDSYGSRPNIDAVYCPKNLGDSAVCSESTADIGPRYADRAYPTSVSFTGCSVANETASLIVAAQPGDYSYEITWWRNSWGGSEATDPWDRNYASVTVTFTGALAGVRDWGSGRIECGDKVSPPVTPEAPAVEDMCGPDNATWITPSQEGVVWNVASTGTGDAYTATATATAANGFSVADGAQTVWTTGDSGEPCATEDPDPPDEGGA